MSETLSSGYLVRGDRLLARFAISTEYELQEGRQQFAFDEISRWSPERYQHRRRFDQSIKMINPAEFTTGPPVEVFPGPEVIFAPGEHSGRGAKFSIFP